MSDDALFTDTPAPGGDLFTDEPAPQSYLSKTVSNILPDLKQTAEGVGGMIKEGAFDMPKRALETGLEMTSGTPYAETPSGKRDVSLVENAPKQAEEMARPVTHPVDYFSEHPVQQTLNLLGAAELGKGLIPGAGDAESAAARVIPKEAPTETPPSVVPLPPEAPKGLPVLEPGAKTGDPHALFAYNDKFGPGGSERSIYNIYGDPEHPTVKARGWGSSVPAEELEKAGIPITGREPKSASYEPLPNIPKQPPQAPPDAAFTDNMAQKAKEVNGYINQKYGNFAKKPGAIADVADYVQEKSQMMAGQQMGFTPLQNRQLGSTPSEQLANMRAIGQYGIDSGIVSPVGGLRHMVETNKALLDKSGQILGDLRKEADALRDPKTTPIDPLQEIHKQLDPIFARGARANEAGSFQRALETVEDHPSTFQGMAKASTDLNKAANSAAKLNQPHGAFTDVANVISRIENDRIRHLLGPEKAANYDQALKEFGINKKIESALKRKVGGEVKRMGPGSLTSNLTQKALDEVGYRVGARAANKLSGAILKNPAMAKNLPSLFKEFANHIDETVGEVSGMFRGGRVPDDVRQYVSKGC